MGKVNPHVPCVGRAGLRFVAVARFVAVTMLGSPVIGLRWGARRPRGTDPRGEGRSEDMATGVPIEHGRLEGHPVELAIFGRVGERLGGPLKISNRARE